MRQPLLSGLETQDGKVSVLEGQGAEEAGDLGVFWFLTYDFLIHLFASRFTLLKYSLYSGFITSTSCTPIPII